MHRCVDRADIMHGHYAGRDLPKVTNVLRSIASNFRFLEALEISHVDGKPPNFVVSSNKTKPVSGSLRRTRGSTVDLSSAGQQLTKMIDFDASADYGKNVLSQPMPACVLVPPAFTAH